MHCCPLRHCRRRRRRRGSRHRDCLSLAVAAVARTCTERVGRPIEVPLGPLKQGAASLPQEGHVLLRRSLVGNLSMCQRRVVRKSSGGPKGELAHESPDCPTGEIAEMA